MVSKSSTRLVYSFIQYSSLMLFLAFSVKAEASPGVIYFGDSEVSTGQPFSISCIISVYEPIQWMRNGTELDKNDRNYLVFESYMQGKPDMIEASISVKNAEPKHEGFYKCNSRYNHTFFLHVNDDLYTTTIMSLISTKLPKQTSTSSTMSSAIITTTTTATLIIPTMTSNYKDILYYHKNDETFVLPNNGTLLSKNSEISKSSNGILKPNYDVVEQKLKYFTIRKALMISCDINIPNSEKLILEWLYNNKSLSQAFASRNLVINDVERRFTLERTEETDIGEYACRLPSHNLSATIHVIALPMVKLPMNTPVVEGEKLSITCAAIGTNPVFYWQIGNTTYKHSADRVTLSKDAKGRENAVLSYEVAELSDRGNFTCLVKNNATYLIDSIEPIVAVTYVRVKGKLAALWPFIGIVAEVFVLCAIILIYEKRRNKQDPEESDTDSPEIKNDNHGKDSEVRQRK